MKGIKALLAAVSLLAFVVSFSVFIISTLTGFYGNLVWSGLTSFSAFIALVVLAGNPDNATYLRNFRR